MPKSYTRNNVSCFCSSCFNNSGFIQGSSHCTGWEEEKLQRKLVKESKKAKVQPVKNTEKLSLSLRRKHLKKTKASEKARIIGCA